MLESLNSECEAIKQDQKMHLEKLEEQLSRTHGQEVNELKNKVWITVFQNRNVPCLCSSL